MSKRFLINRTDAIGDTILTIPLAQKIKEKYPDAKVAFLVSPKSVDLFRNHPFVDECFSLDKKRSVRSSFKIFSQFAPTHYLHVGGSFAPTLVAFLKAIPFRGGLLSRWPSFLFLNHGVRQRRIFTEMHEVEYNLNLLRPLDISYTDQEKLGPFISMSPAEVEGHYQDFSNEVGLSGKLIIVHPGMMGHTLNWPLNSYIALIKKMQFALPEYRVVISYTPTDEKIISYFKTELCHEKDVIFYDGSKKGLRHFMGVISKADLFIGPSTGPTHIANVLGRKVLGFYSPIRVQSALRWGPFFRQEDTTIVLVPDVVCGEHLKCAGESCPYYKCMEKIEVDDVILSIKKLLQK